MPLASLANRPPTTPQERTIERSAPGQVTGRLKRALDAMLWQGLTRAKAAEHANISEHSLYVALRRPHVKAYYASELQVLRESERARSIHRLAELREQDSNKMVAFNAAKELAGSSDSDPSHANKQSLPGLVVVINGMGDTRLTQPAPVVLDNDDGSST